MVYLLVVFVGYNVIGKGYDAGMLILLYAAQNCAKCWSHEGQPVTYQYDIGSYLTDGVAHLYPVERMHGIDH